TAYVLLHHYMGEIDGAFRSWGFVRGGTGAVSNAIASAAREAGAEIRTEAPAAKIIIEDGQAKGVVLENGDEVRADIVSSSVDPRLTFMKMAGPENLPSDFVEDIARYKFRGSSGKVNLALDALPNFKCLPGAGAHLRGAISISPTVEYMERAYDDAKYGRFSRRPYIDIVIPSLTDPSVAPPGKHVMSCFVQYAPYHLKDGTWDEKREKFGDTVIDTLAEYAPNLRDIILHRQVLTPLDIERRFGLSEGNIFQGELTLEQLFFLCPAVLHAAGPLLPKIAAELQLEKHGLSMIPSDVRVLALDPDGPSLRIYDDSARTAMELTRLSARDAKTYAAFHSSFEQLGRALAPVLSMTPPDVDDLSTADYLNLGKLGLNFRSLD